MSELNIFLQLSSNSVLKNSESSMKWMPLRLFLHRP